MNTQVNWQKLRNEFQRLADVDWLKNEVHRIGHEIRKLDFQAMLSPSAQGKIKNFEKRYTELMRTIHQAQRQVDREFNRILRQVKGHRADVSRVVTEQKNKLEKASMELKKRFTKMRATKKSAASQTGKGRSGKSRKSTSGGTNKRSKA